MGTLQSNITVRSIVEDVETKSHSHRNKEGNPMQIKWSQCKQHPNYLEECFLHQLQQVRVLQVWHVRACKGCSQYPRRR